VLNKSKLLGTIGQAEMQREVQNWVKNLAEVHTSTKIPSYMTEEDVKSYVEEVVKEVKKMATE
jgi:hypothetical protein